MATGVEELLDMLYEMIDEAKNAPLSSDKCVIERDKALDLLDDIRAQFPVELGEAKKLLAARNEYITSARREAELIRKQAEEQAKQMRVAEQRSRELKKAANEYCEDALRRTEEAVAEAYDEIKKSRARFRAAAGGVSASASGQGNPRVYDAAADED